MGDRARGACNSLASVASDCGRRTTHDPTVWSGLLGLSGESASLAIGHRGDSWPGQRLPGLLAIHTVVVTEPSRIALPLATRQDPSDARALLALESHLSAPCTLSRDGMPGGDQCGVTDAKPGSVSPYGLVATNESLTPQRSWIRFRRAFVLEDRPSTSHLR